MEFRHGKTFCFLILYAFLTGCCRGSVSDISFQVLQRNIHQKNDKPFCVLYKSENDNSKLEKGFTAFYKKLKPDIEYSSWSYGTFKVDKAMERQKHLKEATLQTVQDDTESNTLVVVGFPSVQKHYQVESLLEDARAQWKQYKIGFLIAHHNTKHSTELALKLGVTDFPAIAFVERNSSCKEKFQLLKLLKSFDMNLKSIDMVLLLRFIPATKLNSDSLLNLTKTENASEASSSCTLILLHGPSAPLSQPALSLYWRTIYFLKQWNIHMDYAVMEVRQDNIVTVSQVFPKSTSKKLPFTALICKNDTEYQMLGISGRPSVSNIVPQLENISVLRTVGGKKRNVVLPWGYTDPNQVSLLTEGPHGYLCTPYSHNETITDPCVLEDHQTAPKQEPRIPFGSWHDRYDSGNLESKLSHVGTLPLLNKAMWYEVIDKSHAPKHPFYPGEQKWSGEVTKTSLVIFIQEGCGNCMRKLKIFENIKKAVEYVDGGAVYLVNCSMDPELCEENKINGFPTLVAYRGLGWMEANHCTQLDPKQQPQHVEIEYHGVILEKNVMSWFVKMAGKAVTNMRFEPLPMTTLEEPVQLVANLVPRSSKYIYAATHRLNEVYYPYECFRLACEKLYSQLNCVARYHPIVPKREFAEQEDDLVVTQILMYRADGYWATIMSAGQPLMDTLKGEELSNTNKFHKPHNYEIPHKKQKCEEDPGFCTDLITEFTKDHGRLPITHVTAEHFHLRDSFLFHNNLPVVVALVHRENMTENSTFYETLLGVAASLYNDMVVVTVDVDQYSVWAHHFIPRNFYRGSVEKEGVPSVYIYPRLCVIYWNDHYHAAFYPPVDVTYTVEEPFRYDKDDILKFMRKFLEDPNSLLVATEHF